MTVTKTVFTTPGKSVPVPADGPLTSTGYRAITAGLRKLLGRDPLLLQVGLYDEYAYFRVYDKTTGFADDYNWRNGVFAPPEPYKVGSTDVAALAVRAGGDRAPTARAPSCATCRPSSWTAPATTRRT